METTGQEALVENNREERKASRSQYYSPRQHQQQNAMMMFVTSNPGGAVGGNVSSASSRQPLGKTQKTQKIAQSVAENDDDSDDMVVNNLHEVLDDPSCISFSENIDESPNRKKHFKGGSGGSSSNHQVGTTSHQNLGAYGVIGGSIRAPSNSSGANLPHQDVSNFKIYEFNYNEQQM